MSGLVGKGTKSYRKKNVAESNIPAIGIKTIKWVIQRTDTGTPGSPGVQNRFLNWTSLVGVPTELGDFQQPSVSTIQRLFTGQFRNNLRVVSNYNGELIDFDTYEVSDAGIILDGDYTIEPDADLGDEYIVFEFNRGAVTGNRIVDARPLRASGEIDLSVIAADTPFNFDVGQFFKIAGSVVDSNNIDSQQVGNVQVFVNGILQFRNTGNMTAAQVEASETDNIEGNYQEVNGSNNNDGSTGGVANAIRFNKKEDFPGVTEINVMVISTNLIVDNPESITLQDGIDGLQTQINAIDANAITANTNELATIPAVSSGSEGQVLQVNAGATAFILGDASGGGGAGTVPTAIAQFITAVSPNTESRLGGTARSTIFSYTEATWVCPDEVEAIFVEMGGGGSSRNTAVSSGGTNGSAGAWYQGWHSVVPGNTYTLRLGNPGIGSQATGQGQNGGPTQISGTLSGITSVTIECSGGLAPEGSPTGSGGSVGSVTFTNLDVGENRNTVNSNYPTARDFAIDTNPAAENWNKTGVWTTTAATGNSGRGGSTVRGLGGAYVSEGGGGAGFNDGYDANDTNGRGGEGGIRITYFSDTTSTITIGSNVINS